MSLKTVIFGNPISNQSSVHERLNKKTGLAVFSSDALSSTAYASEEILLVLAVAVVFGQTMAFDLIVPISVAIVMLLWLVATSYRQTIQAYPSGGGAYVVAKENLGIMPGLVAGGSLLTDYVLTVAVSISAGTAAITSAARGTSFEWIIGYKIWLCVAFIILVAYANLRGVRESGTLFAIPTFGFIICFFILIAVGLIKYAVTGDTIVAPQNEEIRIAEGFVPQMLTIFLILSAFANGCAALTGIEAVSNGVQAFEEPSAKNAGKTLIIMAVILTVMFIGTSLLAFLYHVHPHSDETVISQFAREIFTGPFMWFYYVIQAATALILILAANTAFADFPRLASLLANDKYLPRQFANRGDKFVFTYGIILLSLAAIILIIVFDGSTSKLIPLYAVGVFLSFTLSQSGMVVHWLKERRDLIEKALEKAKSDSKDDEVVQPVKIDNRWFRSLLLNLSGAIVTGIVLMIFVVTKFTHGAWLIVLIIPMLVIAFRATHKHYMSVGKQLAIDETDKIRELRHKVVIPISGIHKGTFLALNYARSIAKNNITSVFVDVDGKSADKMIERWSEAGIDVPLQILESSYRSLTKPLLDYLEKTKSEQNADLITVVLPEFVPARWWHQLLHNQSSLLLKSRLLFKKGIVVINIPYHLTD